MGVRPVAGHERVLQHRHLVELGETGLCDLEIW
jgi:hypothetical protein